VAPVILPRSPARNNGRARLTGWAEKRLAEMTPPGFVARIDLTITDDFPLAQAFVVISAWPADWPKP
jgi:holo-[acyl-carrier protein] synthase